MIGAKQIGATASAKSWHVTRFTTVGANTWTKAAASADLAFVRCIGGGGGGGRGVGTSTTFTGQGQGGHGAMCVEQWVDISTLTSATATVGAAGVGATVDSTAGGAGGDSTFGTLVRGPGGRGGGYSIVTTNTSPNTSSTQWGAWPSIGVYPSIPGAMGNETGSYVHPLNGDTRAVQGTTNTYLAGGAGGGSRLGPGGNGGNGVATGAGNNGSAPASGYGGGGGGGSGGSTTSGNGGNGAAGVIEVWEFY